MTKVTLICYYYFYYMYLFGILKEMSNRKKRSQASWEQCKPSLTRSVKAFRSADKYMQKRVESMSSTK
ncbi:MAG: hypothetical protein K6T85_06140 [Gorillibacterium sp.]|nr:hypothetical protein [Gorillibacterium sp.]